MSKKSISKDWLCVYIRYKCDVCNSVQMKQLLHSEQTKINVETWRLWFFAGHEVEIALFESTTEILVQRRISVEVSCPPAEGGQEDICFPSPGTVAALLWGYLPPSISWWSEHAPSLPERKPPRQRVSDCRRCWAGSKGSPGARWKEEERRRLQEMTMCVRR